MKKTQQGVTTIQVAIVLGTAAVIAAVVFPAYNKFVKKGQFADVIKAAESVRPAVEKCATEQGTLTGCSSGLNGIPTESAIKGAYLNKITVTDGRVMAVASAGESGLNAATYVLHADYTPAAGVTWSFDAESSTCDEEGICKK